MATIYVACAAEDSAAAYALRAELSAIGHDATMDIDHMPQFETIERDMFSAFKGTDVFLFIVSEKSKESLLLNRQVSSATSYAGIAGDMAVLAVSLDGSVLKGYETSNYIDGSKDAKSLSGLVDHKVSIFLSHRAASRKKAADFAKQVEEDSSTYIDEVLKSQKSLELRNWASGTFWYVIGFVSLIASAAIPLWHVFNFGGPAELMAVIRHSVQLVLLVGILAACSKYAFVLGKSYVNESLKNSDRIHAISFGKFYLKAFGQNANWTDVKEVFQHWNIDKHSSFKELEPSSFDPKALEIFSDMYKATIDKIGVPNAKAR